MGAAACSARARRVAPRARIEPLRCPLLRLARVGCVCRAGCNPCDDIDASRVSCGGGAAAAHARLAPIRPARAPVAPVDDASEPGGMTSLGDDPHDASDALKD